MRDPGTLRGSDIARGRSHYLIPAREQLRVRRAADMTRVVLAVLILLWSWSRYVAVDDVQATVSEATARIPDWLVGISSVVYAIMGLYALGVFIAILSQWRTRRDAVRDMVLASAVTFAVVSLSVKGVSGEWPRYLPELGRADAMAQFPVIRVAIVTAALRVVSPHLTRPMRWLGWIVIALGGLSGVALGLGLPSSILGSFAAGVIAAGLVFLVFGSPAGYPAVHSIQAALEHLDVPVSNLRLDPDQSWGVRRLLAESERFGSVEVKVYGRDATDSQVAARAWRYVWYRDTEPGFSLTRVRSVEHEAFITLMASRTGASVPQVLTAGVGGDDMAILAVSRRGGRLGEVEAEHLTDDMLADIWRSVGRLHEGGISHGNLTTAAITVDGASHQIGDFGSGTIGATGARLALDVVELLFSLSFQVGVERTVRSAHRALGSETLGGILPYVQLPGVSASSRRMVEKPKVLIGQIGAEIRSVSGAPETETVQLQRVSGRSLIMAGLSLIAIYVLIGMLSGIDFATVWETLADANYALMAVAFLIGQFVFLPEATGMLAAVNHPIPLKPSVVLQSAIKYISLAVPSSAGRIGMQAAFLRKHGVSFTSSLVQGSIDTISGLIVEVTILVLAFAFGELELTFVEGERAWGLVLLILAVVAVVVLWLVRHVEKIRNWVMPIVGDAWTALGGVIKDPKRTGALLGSNLASRLVLAISLWFILQSMGVSLGILSVLAATVLTGLLGGIVPVPGGIGVSEAVLTASLVIFGVDETVAFAAAVVYRIVTFYIPSAYGWFSMKWLDRHGYI